MSDYQTTQTDSLPASVCKRIVRRLEPPTCFKGFFKKYDFSLDFLYRKYYIYLRMNEERKREMKIGNIIRNRDLNTIEVVIKIKEFPLVTYINGYKADAIELLGEKLDKATMEIVSKATYQETKWNRKYYGSYIYLNGEKVKVEL